MTYPDAEVISHIEGRFIPVKLQIDRETELARRHNVHWTPGLLCLTPDGTVQHRFVGYLPPEEFLALLHLMEGLTYFHRGGFEKARDFFDRVAARWPRSQSAPEALYWLAVSHYKLGDKDKLVENWTKLRDQHPQSVWHLKSSFLFD